MTRWTDEELRILIRNRRLPAERLTELLPGRTIGGIGAALGGIDQHLNGRDVAGLLSRRGLEIREEECPR